MPNDFQKAQPSKNEKMFYEIIIRQEAMGRDLWTVSANVLALCLLLKVDPKKVAELLVDEKQTKEYADQINAELRKIEDAKKAAGKDNETTEHNHSHDHAGPNHKHE